jgi:hypothetical protein
MNLRIHLLAAALGAVIAGFAAPLFAAPQAEQGAPLAEPSKSLYWQGHEALGRSDWTAALQHFRALERDLAASKTEPADAAIYWQAYALSQARRVQEATAQVDRLRQAYPRSAWLDDAESLVARSDADATAAADDRPAARAPKDPREEDALMALDALLAGGNKKAVPLLQRVLSGDHSDKVKGRAIFVLSQVDAKAADESLAAILQGGASSRLKAEAIRMIAAGGRRASLDRLLPIYRQSRDEAVKRGVLDAFLIGDRGDLMLQVVESETEAKRRHEAIEKLGAMGEREQLGRLYASRTDAGDRRAVLRAMGIAGAHDALIEVARTETEPKLKAEAIRSVGIAGGKKAAAALLPLYRPDQPEAVRKAVMEALMIAGASKELVQLYRQETDPRLKRDLLHQISVSDSDAALELIDEKLR